MGRLGSAAASRAKHRASQADLVLDEAGVPKTIGRESELPGLYFVGFEVRLLGLLYTATVDARAVVERIAA